MEQRNHQRRFDPLHRLQVVCCVNIERQQQQAGEILPQDSWNGCQYLRRWSHIETGDLCREQHGKDHGNKADAQRHISAEVSRLPYPIHLSGSHIFRYNGLCRIADTVAECLNQSEQIPGNAVDRQLITSKVTHDLIVEQHNDDSHSNGAQARGKTDGGNCGSAFPKVLCFCKSDRVLFGKQVDKLNEKYDGLSE